MAKKDMKKMKQKPELMFHKEVCFNCRYYRTHQGNSDCLLLGRTLSLCPDDGYADRARYCSAWKKRPKGWEVCAHENPFWRDKYIPRETLVHLRQKLFIN